MTIFVDAETETVTTTESAREDGASNVMLTRLHLDRLNIYAQILCYMGLLSTCYVLIPPEPNESESSTKTHGMER